VAPALHLGVHDHLAASRGTLFTGQRPDGCSANTNTNTNTDVNADAEDAVGSRRTMA